MELDLIKDSVENSSEYKKIKKYENIKINETVVATFTILTLVFFFLFLTALALYVTNLTLIFIILSVVIASLFILFAFIMFYLRKERKKIIHDIDQYINHDFYLKIYKEYYKKISSKIQLNSLTYFPDIPIKLTLSNNLRTYETYINGKYKNINFSIGSFVESTSGVKYQNSDTTSIEKPYNSFYRYITLSYKIPNNLNNKFEINLKFKKLKSKEDAINNITLDNFYEIKNKLSSTLNQHIINLIKKTKYVPIIKIKENSSFILNTIDISNIDDLTGAFAEVYHEKRFEILPKLCRQIKYDLDRIELIVEWINDFVKLNNK